VLFLKGESMLKVNEIFYTIQGEGQYAGTAMVFIRLSGCNLKCPFCDTQHQTFTSMTEKEILAEVKKYSPLSVCITGGEPLKQNTFDLTEMLYEYTIHLETNGTYDIPWEYNYVCISPKNKEVSEENLYKADSIKILCGPEGWEEMLDYYKNYDFKTFLQPMSLDPVFTKQAVEYIKYKNPKIRLSTQIHKYIKEK
jgi:7-carboxy-7-deazaguanine synthase